MHRPFNPAGQTSSSAPFPTKMQPSTLVVPAPKKLENSVEDEMWGSGDEEDEERGLTIAFTCNPTSQPAQISSPRQISIDRVKSLHQNSQLKLNGLTMKHKMATLQEKQLYREFRLSDLQNTEQSSNPSLLDTNFSPKNEEIVAKK